MKFGTSLFALVFASLAVAAPSTRRPDASSAPCPAETDAPNGRPTDDPAAMGGNQVQTSSGSSGSVGAAYFISNDPAGNNIIVSSIAQDGTLAFSNTVSTGGSGQHGEDGGQFASDATYSNSIITVHNAKRLLATTNTMSNTVSLFTIDPEDPTNITMFGDPVESRGDFPTSVAFSNDGDRLCVMNSGRRAGILCYGVTDRGLAIQEETFRDITQYGYNQTTLPSGPINTLSQIIFTEDDRNLVVAVKGFVNPQPTRGALLVWSVADNGALADDAVVAGTPAPGGFTFSLTPIPGRNAFFSADFSSGLDVWDFNQGINNINASSSRTVSLDVPGEITACWSTWSPTLDRYYISDPSTLLLTEVAIDNDLTPRIVANHTIDGVGENIDVAVATIDGQDYLYALLTSSLNVGVVSLDGPGQTSLAGVTNYNSSGVPLQPNFAQGMATFIRPGI